jgi:hypothetical protein
MQVIYDRKSINQRSNMKGVATLTTGAIRIYVHTDIGLMMDTLAVNKT